MDGNQLEYKERPHPEPMDCSFCPKVNVDANWQLSGKAGAGLVARGANREFMATKCVPFLAESVVNGWSNSGVGRMQMGSWDGPCSGTVRIRFHGTGWECKWKYSKRKMEPLSHPIANTTLSSTIHKLELFLGEQEFQSSGWSYGVAGTLEVGSRGLFIQAPHLSGAHPQPWWARLSSVIFWWLWSGLSWLPWAWSVIPLYRWDVSWFSLGVRSVMFICFCLIVFSLSFQRLNLRC